MSFNSLLVDAAMDSKNSEKEIWLKYCEACVKSKIANNCDSPPELTEEVGKEKGL